MWSEGDGEPGGLLVLPDGFDYEAMVKVASHLELAGVFVPGYIPPGVGMYCPDGFIYRRYVEEAETILLPDLNIVSDLAQLARGEEANKTRRTSAAILSFCQHHDIQIDPSIAIHELASSVSDERAAEDLSLFRAADNMDFAIWRDIALGRRNCVSAPLVGPDFDVRNLSRPLMRWNRNYILALKAAQIELSSGTSLERVEGLLDWMREEFIVGGPLIAFACTLFAPNSPPRAGLLKSLRSPDRNKALKGVRNTAWDATHLSFFIEKVNGDRSGSCRFIFSSHDAGLMKMAYFLFRLGYGQFGVSETAKHMAMWWSESDAIRVSKMVISLYESIDDPKRKRRQQGAPKNIIQQMIDAGEREVLAWSPN